MSNFLAIGGVIMPFVGIGMYVQMEGGQMYFRMDRQGCVGMLVAGAGIAMLGFSQNMH